MRTRSLIACLVCVFCSSLNSCMLGPRKGAIAAPQRYRFSSDIHTVQEASWQLETGLSFDPGTRLDTPLVASYGSSERSQLLFEWSPWVHVVRDGKDGNGPSDFVVGYKHRFLDATDEAPGVAIQMRSKLATGSTNEGISSGENDFFAAGILSQDLAGWSLTGFYELGVLGKPLGSGSKLQHAFAFSGTRPWDEQLSGFGELVAIFRPEAGRDAVFATLGATWSPRKSTVLDASFSFGLNRGAADFRLNFGMTINFGAPPRPQ